MMHGRQLRTWLLLILVNILWAVQYPAYRVASDNVSAAALCFWTFLIAIAVLLPALLWNRRKKRKRGTPAQIFRSVYRFLILGVCGLIPPSVIIAWGIARSSAADASILALAIPVEMALMGVLMLKERPGRLMILSIVLALAGSVVISWNAIASGSFSGPTLMGIVAIIIGQLGAAFYNAYGKRLVVDHSPIEVLVYGYAVGVAMCAAISGVFDPTPFYRTSEWSWSVWGAIAVLGIVVWGLAQLLWVWLLSRLELVRISVSVYLTPFLSLLVSVWVLGEHVGLYQLGGGVIVLLSAYLSSAPPRQPDACENVGPSASQGKPVERMRPN